MRLLPLILFFALAGLFSSCGTTHPAYTERAPAYSPERQETITKSLFDSKDKTISEEDIQRLLSGRIIIPDTVRVALFNYSGASINRYYTNWWTDEEYLKTQQSFVDTLIGQIAASPKVKKVIPVPSLMSSANPNMTQLRETAVRLQADILVVYAISSDIYYKYKVFQKDEAKAFATCETILMDTRTGVIPHATIVTKEKLVLKGQEELSDSETRKKAEREAVWLALLETGQGISSFLNQK